MSSLSKSGLALAGLYIVVAAYLIATQGLFGESFIALILGLPWVLLFALIEFGGLSAGAAAIMLLLPMALNAALLYFIGAFIGRFFARQ